MDIIQFNQLDISKLSAQNRAVVKEMIDEYDLLELARLTNIVSQLDIHEISHDYELLIKQIKDTVYTIRLPLYPTVIDSLNKALNADNYLKARDYIERGIGFINQDIPHKLVPKIMELNTVWRHLAFLNSCPGASGKPNNSIPLAELTV